MTCTILCGDASTVLRSLPAGCCRCCITSPPYLWQREYLGTDHPDKHLEIGREPTVDAYVEALVAVFREVRRVLAPDGTVWINIGDRYANDAKWGGSTGGRHAKRHHGETGIGRAKVTTGLPPKSLMGVPWRLAFALQDDGWVLRSEVIWAKGSVMPEGNVHDRPTRSHEHVFLLAKSPTYFYAADSIRQPHRSRPQRRPTGRAAIERPGQPSQTFSTAARDEPAVDGHPLGRNCRSVWDDINTEPSDGAHAAPMPRALARRCILAGSGVGDHVLDPFGGSGTVGLVADEEGRHATLIDLDERAVATARRRTAQGGLMPAGAA